MAERRTVARAPAVVAAVALAFLLAGAAPAEAIVLWQGTTWYSDGSFQKMGPSGTAVSAFATNARPNHSYKLFSSPFIPERDHELCGYSLTPVNPAVRVANDRGFIAITGGQITGSPGDYVLCFVDLDVPTDPSHPEGYYSATLYVWFKIT